MRATTLQAVVLPLLLFGALEVGKLPLPQAAGVTPISLPVQPAIPFVSPSRAHASPSIVHPTLHLLSTTTSVPNPLIRVSPSHTAPPQGWSILGAPTVSVTLINRVLASYNSPMQGEGKQIYDLGVKYGIDPVYCLAFFVHESSAGTAGEAVLTHSVGNIRPETGEPSLDGYRYYDTWVQGAEDWYRLMKRVYATQWGLSTVPSIIPVYAPSADSNDPIAYIQSIESLVTQWRAQMVAP